MTYRPISCNFYDELEALATLKQEAHIRYRTPEGALAETKGRIVHLFAKAKEEFLVLDTGFQLRLDYLVSVNGKELKNYC
jgi:Rho-binding antiterminator